MPFGFGDHKTPAEHSHAFGFSFEWGDIPLCTSGTPNIVPNPIFTLRAVPDGTASIEFHLADLDVPQFDHGGGLVPYADHHVVAPGAFNYKSPCPPSGSHTYEWTATALDMAGNTLAVAKSRERYP